MATLGIPGFTYQVGFYVAVVRKKDERRKLKGTTCKECEIVSVWIMKQSNSLFFFFTTHPILKTFISNSITLISQRRKSRRSCLHVPDTDFCIFLLVLLKISGKLDSHQRRRALKEVIQQMFYFSIKPSIKPCW